MRFWLFAGCVALAAGCGSDDKSFRRYMPSPDTARHALDAALRSWKEGRPAGEVEAGPPKICLVDNCRRPEQTLESYTILGESAGRGAALLRGAAGAAKS